VSSGRYREKGVLVSMTYHTLSGSQKFIDLHLEVERDMRLQEAHDVSVRVLRELKRRFPRPRVIHSAIITTFGPFSILPRPVVMN